MSLLKMPPPFWTFYILIWPTKIFTNWIFKSVRQFRRNRNTIVMFSGAFSRRIFVFVWGLVDSLLIFGLMLEIFWVVSDDVYGILFFELLFFQKCCFVGIVGGCFFSMLIFIEADLTGIAKLIFCGSE